MIVADGFSQHYPAAGVIAFGGLLGLIATHLITINENGAGRAQDSLR
jgi:hypothetical protein